MMLVMTNQIANRNLQRQSGKRETQANSASAIDQDVALTRAK
jgi:hypothetical protein